LSLVILQNIAGRNTKLILCVDIYVWVFKRTLTKFPFSRFGFFSYAQKLLAVLVVLGRELLQLVPHPEDCLVGRHL
jgi:hypothetical protein